MLLVTYRCLCTALYILLLTYCSLRTAPHILHLKCCSQCTAPYILLLTHTAPYILRLAYCSAAKCTLHCCPWPPPSSNWLLRLLRPAPGSPTTRLAHSQPGSTSSSQLPLLADVSHPHAAADKRQRGATQSPIPSQNAHPLPHLPSPPSK